MTEGTPPMPEGKYRVVSKGHWMDTKVFSPDGEELYVTKLTLVIDPQNDQQTLTLEIEGSEFDIDVEMAVEDTTVEEV